MKSDQTLSDVAVSTEEETNYLSADDIFNSEDIDYVDVVIPEWKRNGKPGVLRLRAMTAGEAIKFTEELKDNKKADSYVRIVAATAIDPKTGERIFNGDLAVKKLLAKKSGIFIRLQTAAMKLNELGGDVKNV